MRAAAAAFASCSCNVAPPMLGAGGPPRRPANPPMPALNRSPPSANPPGPSNPPYPRPNPPRGNSKGVGGGPGMRGDENVDPGGRWVREAREVRGEND